MNEHETSEPTPELDELLQQEHPWPVVQVDVQGGTVYQLPARRVICTTDVVTDTQAQQLAPANHKRSRLVLIATDQPVYIARDRTSQGTIWPINVPHVVTHCDAVWVKSATASNSSTVGVTQEMWAD
jgi:hypothetical protein